MVLVLFCEVSSMKTKITTITPVHIGSGEQKKAFEYHKMGDDLFCYDVKDIFFELPTKELIDPRFLKSLAFQRNGSTRSQFNRQFRGVNYEKIRPIYQLKCKFDNNENEVPVDEQLKTLYKPIIPGSTLKGAIMNSILFDIVNTHFDEVCHIIEKSYKRPDAQSIIQGLYPGKDTMDHYSIFCNCFMCSDVTFDSMILLHQERANIKNNKSLEKFLSDKECISPNQSVIGNYFSYNETSVARFKRMCQGRKIYKDLSIYFNERILIQVISNYFKIMLEEDIDSGRNFYFKDAFFENLKKSKKPNSFYLRVGGSTNYFFKTVSYLIKKHDYSLYEKLFDIYFSPKSNGKRNDRNRFNKKRANDPKPEDMPVTRTIFMDDEDEYYPGVIKVEFLDV